MKKTLTVVTAFALLATSVPAFAGVHTDAHGNVGFDTLAECQAAISSGRVKFYQSHTHKPSMLRAGEKFVTKGFLADLGTGYENGTCDLGTAHRGGRDGVARELQGKYVPYAPNMAIYQYSDASGKVVRVSMQQCDNWFSGNFPQPFNKAAMPKPQQVKVPVPEQVKPVLKPVQAIKPAVTTASKLPAGAVAAAQGATAAWVPLAALAAVGAGAAVLLNDDSSTNATTGTR